MGKVLSGVRRWRSAEGGGISYDGDRPLVVRNAIGLDRPLAGRDLGVFQGRVSFEPAGGRAAVIGDGLYVLPGLVDSHAHLSFPPPNTKGRKAGVSGLGTPQRLRRRALASLREQIARGVLLVRDAGAASSLVADLVGETGSTLPRLQAAGRFIAAPGRYVAGLAHEADGEELLKAGAAEAASGGGWVKLVVDFPARDASEYEPGMAWDVATLTHVIEVIHAIGARVAVHAMTKAGASASLQAGVDSIEHGYGLTREQLQVMADRGIAWTPTLCALQRTSLESTSYGSIFQTAFLEACIGSLTAILPEAAGIGVTILCGTDGALRAGDVAREAIELIAAGLPVENALRACSGDGWRFLREDEPLADGSPADFLLFEDDPRLRPEVLFQPRAIVRDGRVRVWSAGHDRVPQSRARPWLRARD